MKSTFALLACLMPAVAQMPAAWTPEFSMEFQTVGSVAPSPDGKMVVWTQTRNVMEPERSEKVTQIFAGSADGSRRFELTREPKGADSPSFSPDGRWVYFIADRTGKTQVYRILLEGGDAEAVTAFKGSLGLYRLSPDGRTVAFTGSETPADEEKARKEKRDFRVVDADPPDKLLYSVPAEPDADGKRPQKKIVTARYHIADFDWAPDSRSIAFERWPSPDADNWTKADIGEVDVASGRVHDLAATKAAESHPRYSPDGRYIAWVRSSDPPRWASDDHLVLQARRPGQTPRVLVDTADREPKLIGWSADGTRIYFLEAHRTREALYAMPLDGPPTTVYEPERGVIAGVGINRGATYLGFAQETPEQAPEAYVMALGGSAPVRVSRANLDLPQLPLGKTEAIRWKSRDGTEIEGLLTYPLGYQPGKHYPLILNIHGGPAGAFTETFIGRGSVYPIATFAAHGYAVLRPNPRGSGGYGKDFRFANYGDWGGQDYQDDQTGVDKVIEMGIADPDRLAVMGWSYGGFMTSWTVTQTQRFKAACVGAGVTDLWSFTGTSDIPGFLPDYFGGEFWRQFQAFQAHSPVTFARNVTTPTLVLHGGADIRVPTSQGYEFYHALKQNGVTTKMVVYPRQGHGPTEPKFVLDIMHRHLDWVEQYVQ